MFRDEKNFDLSSCCHVNTDTNGDNFVGIRSDTKGIAVCFPIGYRLGKTNIELQKNIKNLLDILSKFTDKSERVMQTSQQGDRTFVEFPINAFRFIMQDFLNRGESYYTENETQYLVNVKGKSDWARTIKKVTPLIQQNGSIAYVRRIVRNSNPVYNKIITDIHKYCVFKSFSKVGWLYGVGSYVPEYSEPVVNLKTALRILNSKLLGTNNDNNKMLFRSMINVLKFLDATPNTNEFYYGTYTFHTVWEKLIDDIFGIQNKKDYFPRTSWKLSCGKEKIQNPLEPDTIMIKNSVYYVLDAKYYRYGNTGDPAHLPATSSINKQITYGEYVYNHSGRKSNSVYNAFILPFNMQNDLFLTDLPIFNAGIATGDWRNGNRLAYENIFGILIDMRYVMEHYKRA